MRVSSTWVEKCVEVSRSLARVLAIQPLWTCCNVGPWTWLGWYFSCLQNYWEHKGFLKAQSRRNTYQNDGSPEGKKTLSFYIMKSPTCLTNIESFWYITRFDLVMVDMSWVVSFLLLAMIPNLGLGVRFYIGSTIVNLIFDNNLWFEFSSCNLSWLYVVT